MSSFVLNCIIFYYLQVINSLKTHNQINQKGKIIRTVKALKTSEGADTLQAFKNMKAMKVTNN